MRGFGFFRDLPRIWPYLRPYWPLALGSLGMIGLAVLAGLIAPWPFALLVDTVLGNKPVPSLLGFLGGWDRTTLLIVAVVAGLVVTTLESGLTVIDDYINTKLEQRMILDFRSDLFQHAQRLSLGFHTSSSIGGLMFLLTTGAHAMGAVTLALPPLLQSLAMLIAMFVVALQIDAQLALASLTIVPFIYYSTGYYARRIEPRLYHVRGLEAQALSIVHEAMTMFRVIIAFGREHHEHGRFRRQGEEAVNARVGLTVRQTVFSLAVNVITAAGTALVLGLGAWHVLDKQLTVGELLVLMGYIAAVYQPLEAISATVATLQEQFINLRTALDLLETEPEIEDAPDAVAIERAEGRLVFEDVDFTYSGREETLKGISFEVEPGQAVAVVGPTGAGKTTLISLIPRFYDPSRGRVLLDGIDLRKLKLASLRAQISLVLQEPLLFSGTIRDNIRYGRLEASDDEIIEAAKAANAHDFISALPDGYETVLGEGGAQLSGGERQRISVARAFLKDAPILILDEPTSSIDSRTEAVILEALDRLMVGRTTIVIAHRLSTIRNTDTILVLNEGEIVERGTHEELLEAGGLYSQLHAVQRGARRRRRRVRAAVKSAIALDSETNGQVPEQDGDDGDDGARSLEPPPELDAAGAVEASANGANGDDALSETAVKLVASACSLLAGGSADGLHELAARRSDPSPDVRAAATLAEALLREGRRSKDPRTRRAARKRKPE